MLQLIVPLFNLSNLVCHLPQVIHRELGCRRGGLR